MSKYVDNEPNVVYHGNKDYVSRSTLVTTWQRTYAHALVPTEQTEAMLTGSAIHDKIYATAMGDHEFFYKNYFIKETDRFKKGEKEALLAANPGKSMLTKKQLYTVENASEAVLKNPTVKDLMEGSILERSFYFDDPECPMKARPDCMHIEKGYLLDFKSAKDASPYDFCKEIFNRMLDIQAAHYFKVCESVLYQEFNDFYFVAVEKVEPFAVAIYKLDNETILHSKDLHKRMVSNYLASKERPNKGYPLHIQEVTLPEWRKHI